MSLFQKKSGWVCAVDPGLKKSAAAFFLSGRLQKVSFVTVDQQDVLPVASVVMELPQAYPGSPVRPQDLIGLTAAGSAVAARLCRPGESVVMIPPATWKGSVPKGVTRKRIEKILDRDESIAMTDALQRTKESERHNLWDAVGIGLFALGRVSRGCAPLVVALLLAGCAGFLDPWDKGSAIEDCVIRHTRAMARAKTEVTKETYDEVVDACSAIHRGRPR